jgi:ornithine carbamoyltransferase
MGQEHEADERAAVFAPYQVNAKLMSQAAPDAVFLHCLPAHRGSEVTDEVMESPRSVVFDQAENRLHVQKAILLMLLS